MSKCLALILFVMIYKQPINFIELRASSQGILAQTNSNIFIKLL